MAYAHATRHALQRRQTGGTLLAPFHSAARRTCRDELPQLKHHLHHQPPRRRRALSRHLAVLRRPTAAPDPSAAALIAVLSRQPPARVGSSVSAAGDSHSLLEWPLAKVKTGVGALGLRRQQRQAARRGSGAGGRAAVVLPRPVVRPAGRHGRGHPPVLQLLRP